jgi:spore germination protein
LRRYWVIGVLIAAIVILGLWGVSERTGRVRAQTSLIVSHQREFYNLLSEIQGLETVLSKAIVSKSTGQKTMLLTTAWHRAWSAQDYLGALPIDIDTSRTKQFLAQLGDYSYVIAQKTSKGRDLSLEEQQKLADLKNQVTKVESLMSKAESALVREKFNTFIAGLTLRSMLGPRGTWWGLAKDQLLAFLNRPLVQKGELAANPKTSKDLPAQTTLSSPSAVSARDDFRELDEFLKAQPLLIYDGPFSGHLENRKALGLSGPSITRDQAKKLALSFIGEKDLSPQDVTVTESKGVTPAYICSVSTRTGMPSTTGVPKTTAPTAPPTGGTRKTTGTTPAPEVQRTTALSQGGEAIVAVSKIGGKVLWSIDNRAISRASNMLVPGIAGSVPGAPRTGVPSARPISTENAFDKARSFLASKGFRDVEMTGSVVQQNILTASFVPKQSKVILYPDMIKVAVDLLTGRIVAFDASEYYASHRSRTLPAPTFTPGEARRLASPNLRVTSIRLVLIPLPSHREVLTYEIRGTQEKDEYLVYINALNGDEEMIMKVIKTKEGTLTK